MRDEPLMENLLESHMMDSTSHEEKIRVRAYELWEKDGSPEQRADEYWERAKAQVEEEGSGEKGKGGDSKEDLPQ